MKSNVNLLSNLQPIEQGKYPLNDKKFLESLTDPTAIYQLAQVRILAGGYNLTKLQEDIYRQVSQPCAYAIKGDSPWGICIVDGKNKLICKCTNTKCEMISECRPNFDIKELDDFEERKKTWKSRKSQLVYEQKKETYKEVSIIPPKKEENIIGISSNEEIPQKKQEVKKEQKGESFDDKFSEKTTISEVPSVILDVTPITATEKKKVVKVIKKVVQQELEKKEITSIISEPKVEIQINPTAKPFTSFEEVCQEHIIQLSPLARSIINAGPGTGKTYTLIEKIKYMIKEQNIEPSYILILCFSRAAVQVIKERIAKAFADSDENYALQNIDVRTFDSYSTYLYYQAAESGEFALDIKEFEKSDYEERIIKAKEFIKMNPFVLDYKHVFIDEVQDLVGARAEYVTEILRALNKEICGFTLLGDSCQAIYDYNARNQPAFISSYLFYKNLFEEFKECDFLKLTKNYRQDGNDNLIKLAEPLRQNILEEDIKKETVQIIKSSLSNCFSNNRQIKKIEKDDFDSSKKYGILTRTNGQALQIACWFRDKGINYQLFKRTDGKMNIDEWVYWLFSQYEYNTINSEEFSKLFHEIYEGIDNFTITNCWNALVGNLREETSYPVSKILDNVLVNSTKSSEYITKSLLEEPANIVISNIHQAKGKEFDTVILQNDLFSGIEEEFTKPMSQDILDESKVLYVGITRPRKNLYLVPEDDVNDRYISIFYDGRCFKKRCANGGKGSNISNYEIGFAEDLDSRSFASKKGLQDFIENNVKAGARILLRQDYDYSDETNKVRYFVCLEDEPDYILGYTSPAFWEKMKQIYHRMWGNYCEIKTKYAPKEIVDLYVDRLITCISKDRIGINDYLEIGDHFMWLGIDISGFGKAVASRY
jgi:hypothetical protein